MNLTEQQQDIVDHIQANDGLTLVNAVAGAGKTTLLVAIANAIQSKNGLYLAYNKAIALEAKKKFPKGVHCCTTHSLAYSPVVGKQKRKPSFFNYRDITEIRSYEEKLDFIEAYRQFCLSKHTSFLDFIADEDYPEHYGPLGNKYLGLMESFEIDYTHEFYLKYFHILLHNGLLSYDEFDLIMLDEAGDVNEVTLEIFKLLPAKKKVMVGDPYQNIYSFNHTINCFKVMADQGTTLPMSQSFRVADHIAERIEKFGRKYIDKNMRFEGIPLKDTIIESRAYIARTNTSLISKMMELNELGIPYGLTRKASQIFELPLLICSLKPKGFISKPDYKHLQDDVNDYYTNYNALREEYPSLYTYILKQHKEDTVLCNGIKLVARHGAAAIIACYNEARKHEKASQSYMLGTAHSMKGLEADEVTIAPDMNEAIIDAMLHKNELKNDESLPESELTELNLYYVACSRARKSLIGALHL